jgi:hypothetical protein
MMSSSSRTVTRMTRTKFRIRLHLVTLPLTQLANSGGWCARNPGRAKFNARARPACPCEPETSTDSSARRRCGGQAGPMNEFPTATECPASVPVAAGGLPASWEGAVASVAPCGRQAGSGGPGLQLKWPGGRWAGLGLGPHCRRARTTPVPMAGNHGWVGELAEQPRLRPTSRGHKATGCEFLRGSQLRGPSSVGTQCRCHERSQLQQASTNSTRR